MGLSSSGRKHEGPVANLLPAKTNLLTNSDILGSKITELILDMKASHILTLSYVSVSSDYELAC